MKYAGRDTNRSKAQKAIDSISEESRENHTSSISIGASASFGGQIGAGLTKHTTIDYKNNKAIVFVTADGSLDFANPDVGVAITFSFYPFVNNPEVLAGRAQAMGVIGPIPRVPEISGGGKVVLDTEGKFLGVGIIVGKSMVPIDFFGGFTYGSKIIYKKEYTLYEYYKETKPRKGRNKW